MIAPGMIAPGMVVAAMILGSIAAWLVMGRLARADVPAAWRRIAVPLLFGLWLLALWQAAVDGFGIPQVLLPSPSRIVLALVTQAPTLWGDFRQTFLKAVLAGYVIGNLLGLAGALAVDRSPFLKRGLMPLGALISATPVVGIAPIMVMWFGFDWMSKAAVVVVMIIFPMFANATAGLAQGDAMLRDYMQASAASYGQTLLKLRLPQALPFIFNALKINATLALIGAIVAEFFGSPTAGMGFRISVEVARMNVDVVWATIVLAALAGSAFYALIAFIERRLTFWHPSYRR